MNVPAAIIVLLLAVPWSSSAEPVLTERRGCRAGYSLNPFSDLCELCPNGTFTDSYNWESQCQRCSVCHGGRQMVAECTASRNTLCRCPDGYYEHADGCSPQPKTTEPGIIRLMPIVQDFGEQIVIKIQTEQNKTDALLRRVDDIRETIAFRVHARKSMQEQSDNVISYFVAILLLLIIAGIFVVTIVKIQRNPKLRANFWRRQKGHDNKESSTYPYDHQGRDSGQHDGTEKALDNSPAGKAAGASSAVIITTIAEIAVANLGAQGSHLAAGTTTPQGSTSNVPSSMSIRSEPNRRASGATEQVNGMASEAAYLLPGTSSSGLNAASGSAGTEKPPDKAPTDKTGRTSHAVITTTQAEIAIMKRRAEESHLVADTTTPQGSTSNEPSTMPSLSEPNRRASGATEQVNGMASEAAYLLPGTRSSGLNAASGSAGVSQPGTSKIKCLNCGELIELEEGNQYCPDCVEPLAGVSLPETLKIRCLNCGELIELEEGDQYCPDCEEPLAVRSSSVENLDGSSEELRSFARLSRCPMHLVETSAANSQGVVSEHTLSDNVVYPHLTGLLRSASSCSFNCVANLSVRTSHSEVPKGSWEELLSVGLHSGCVRTSSSAQDCSIVHPLSTGLVRSVSSCPIISADISKDLVPTHSLPEMPPAT